MDAEIAAYWREVPQFQPHPRSYYRKLQAAGDEEFPARFKHHHYNNNHGNVAFGRGGTGSHRGVGSGAQHSHQYTNNHIFLRAATAAGGAGGLGPQNSIPSRQRLSQLIQVLAVSETQKLLLADQLALLTRQKDELNGNLEKLMKEKESLLLKEQVKLDSKSESISKSQALLEEKNHEIKVLQDKLKQLEEERIVKATLNNSNVNPTPAMASAIIEEIEKNQTPPISPHPSVLMLEEKLNLIQQELSNLSKRLTSKRDPNAIKSTNAISLLDETSSASVFSSSGGGGVDSSSKDDLPNLEVLLRKILKARKVTYKEDDDTTPIPAEKSTTSLPLSTLIPIINANTLKEHQKALSSIQVLERDLKSIRTPITTTTNTAPSGGSPPKATYRNGGAIPTHITASASAQVTDQSTSTSEFIVNTINMSRNHMATSPPSQSYLMHEARRSQSSSNNHRRHQEEEERGERRKGSRRKNDWETSSSLPPPRRTTTTTSTNPPSHPQHTTLSQPITASAAPVPTASIHLSSCPCPTCAGNVSWICPACVSEGGGGGDLSTSSKDPLSNAIRQQVQGAHLNNSFFETTSKVYNHNHPVNTSFSFAAAGSAGAGGGGGGGTGAEGGGVGISNNSFQFNNQQAHKTKKNPNVVDTLLPGDASILFANDNSMLKSLTQVIQEMDLEKSSISKEGQPKTGGGGVKKVVHSLRKETPQPLMISSPSFAFFDSKQNGVGELMDVISSLNGM